MRIGSFEFRPGLWPTLVMLAIMPVLIGLGFWQLDRAAWKQDVIDIAMQTAQQSPQPLLDVVESGGGLDFRPVVVRGRYALDRQLLVDNRIHQGRAGYHALTPLLLEDGDAVVLVNRGWLPMGQLRTMLPPLPGPEDVVHIAGIIARLPEKVFRLDTIEEPVAGWPQVIQHVDFADIENRLQQAVIPVIVLLDADDPHGFARDWRPIYGITPDKHRAYAMQWFTLAAVLVLIYAGVNTRRIRKQDTQ